MSTERTQHEQPDPEISAGRGALDRWVVRVAEPTLEAMAQHWLGAVNVVLVLFVAGAIAAPFLAAAGSSSAESLYAFYKGICHQWAFRSFFLLGPTYVYSQDALGAAGVDPYSFVGNAAHGWKMAICERDLAIFAGVLAFGALYAARWRGLGLGPSSYLVFAVLCVPMALDGFTQLFGWRESTWELRVATGLLFGMASAWLTFPRFEASLRRDSLGSTVSA